MTTKIAVSLPDDLVAAAREAVSSGTFASVSAYIADALRQRMVREDTLSVLAEIRAIHGEPTDEDRAWVREALVER